MANSTQDLSKYQLHEGDTGSAPVQIALLTERIIQLTEHLKSHRKDVSSRRGLLKMVQKRRKLLDYLHRTSNAKYQETIKSLGLRR